MSNYGYKKTLRETSTHIVEFSCFCVKSLEPNFGASLYLNHRNVGILFGIGLYIYSVHLHCGILRYEKRKASK